MGIDLTVSAPKAVLETVLYAADLAAAETFYRTVLGLEPQGKAQDRHLFYRIGNQMLLIFNPQTTSAQIVSGALPIPPHGTTGNGHVCFAASHDEIEEWRARLSQCSVPIEADFEWPGGGRSIYFRDPAGNCIEFAEPRIWGIV